MLLLFDPISFLVHPIRITEPVQFLVQDYIKDSASISLHIQYTIPEHNAERRILSHLAPADARQT
jgi:hypothetical protein